MAESTIQQYEQAVAEESKKARRQSTIKILRHIVGKLIASIITVSIAVYLTILIANMIPPKCFLRVFPEWLITVRLTSDECEGQVDRMKKAAIREGSAMIVATQLSGNPEARNMTPDERKAVIDQYIALAEKQQGLNKPFFQRSVRYWMGAMTLNLGFSENLMSDSGSRLVRNIILERLPSTLVLLGISYFFLFFSQLLLALRLAQREGGFLDRVVQFLVPTSAAPSWFYGIFLIVLFPAILGVLPFGGMVSAPPPSDPINYALSVGKHLILPVTAIVLSSFFIGLYGQRTFFLIFASEDYVELARAKGVPDSIIERKYILRPTLPTIITSLALTLIGLWQGSLFLELVFSWPGVGELISRAIGAYDTPIIVGTTVVYAYLLAITVFLLDFIYALVDPRVRVGEGSK